jgi:hypothetical protein
MDGRFGFQCADLDAIARFYDAVLATLGARPIATSSVGQSVRSI